MLGEVIWEEIRDWSEAFPYPARETAFPATCWKDSLMVALCPVPEDILPKVTPLSSHIHWLIIAGGCRCIPSLHPPFSSHSEQLGMAIPAPEHLTGLPEAFVATQLLFNFLLRYLSFYFCDIGNWTEGSTYMLDNHSSSEPSSQIFRIVELSI